MAIEQNLDEMVLSLQKVVDDLGEGDAPAIDSTADLSDISTSDLQRRLEEKYFSEGSEGRHESDRSYELDSDVYAEFFENDADEDEVIPAEKDEPSESEIAEIAGSESLTEEIDLPEPSSESTDDLVFEELSVLTDYVLREDISDEEAIDSEQTSDIDEVIDEIDEYEDLVQEFEELDVIDTHTLLDDEPKIEPQAFEYTQNEETEVETEKETEVAPNLTAQTCAPAFDPYVTDLHTEKPMSFKALIMDYGRPDPVPSRQEDEAEKNDAYDEADLETPDMGDILSDFADDSPTKEDKMNSAVHKFMSSLGCEDELCAVSAEDIGEIYGQFNKDEDEIEESSDTAVEREQSEYRKSILFSSLKLAVCAIITFIMFLYDTLPLFDVDFVGLSDYVLYPAAYVMIGTQLLLICAAIMWRDIWNGIKGLLTVYPNIYSMAFVSVCACVFYDMVFFITGGYKPEHTPMFHFLCGTFLTMVCIYSLIIKIRESATYDMYSADVAKFTLTRDKSSHSVGEKMYSGGFSREKKIYMPSAMTNPKGFREAIDEEGSFGNFVYSSLILMSVGVGVIFGIALVIAGRGIEEGSIAAMSAVMALTPVSALAAILAPLAISHIRLKKRGIALTGRKMIRRYGKKNALVFSDLHLFSKCDPSQIGFVCYEKLQTKNVLAALDILYSRIGGPMGEAFANIPEDAKAKSIRVRRITKSGIEAVVDKSHVLLVGDRAFMRRYGIEYPASDESKRGDNVYVSLDGRASAKLMAIYKVEPVFDMLIERLAEEGTHCVIETYDPMINTAFVARHRRSGRTPISVVHKNAADINRVASNAKKRSDHGLLVLSSRLKLAEAVVWCARLCKIEKIQNIVIYVTLAIGLSAVMTVGILGLLPCFIQYLLFAYILLAMIVSLVLTLVSVPQRGYFTTEALSREDAQREHYENQRKERKNDK